MEKISKIVGQAIPLSLKDVDTDLIIPAQYLTDSGTEGYGKYLFKRLKEADPNFIFNQLAFKEASILISGDNFGCGSSREHAVWALKDAGIKAIIAPSFADIFYSNCAKNGLLLIAQSEPVVEDLLKRAMQKLMIEIDLLSQMIQIREEQYSFTIDPFLKYCFINGLDELDYILALKSEINKFRENQEKFL